MKPRIPITLIMCLATVHLGGIAHSQTTTFAKWFGGPKYDAGFCAQPLRNGGFILVGTTLTLTNAWDNVFAVRTDCAGDTMWTRSIGGSANDAGFSVCQTFDGGFVIAGTKGTRPPIRSQLTLSNSTQREHLSGRNNCVTQSKTMPIQFVRLETVELR